MISHAKLITFLHPHSSEGFDLNIGVCFVSEGTMRDHIKAVRVKNVHILQLGLALVRKSLSFIGVRMLLTASLN